MCGGRPEAGSGVSQHLSVPDAQRLDPPLLPQRKRDEESQFDQLRDRKVVVQEPEGRLLQDRSLNSRLEPATRFELVTCALRVLFWEVSRVLSNSP